jgi:hypothetical protein
MGRACSTHDSRSMHTEILWESKKERDHDKDLDVGGIIILDRS